MAWSNTSFLWPNNQILNQFLGCTNTAGYTLNGTTQRAAYMGHVWREDGAGGDITAAALQFGTVVKAGGSGIRLSLQNVSTTANQQPDGTLDQQVDIANGNANFATNAWLTGTFGSARTVSHGDLLAFVVQWDGAGRLGSDTVNIKSVSNLYTSMEVLRPTQASYNGTTWTASPGQLIPAIRFDFSDGASGCFFGAPVFATSVTQTYSYSSSSSPDEYAIEFPIAFDCKFNGVAFYGGCLSNSADFDVCLYQGTTLLASVSCDGNHFHTTYVNKLNYIHFPETELEAGTTYRISFKPTTTNQIRLYAMDVGSANNMKTFPAGTACALTSRTDAGSWASISTTIRPNIALHINKISDGASAGGGGIPRGGSSNLRSRI